MLNKTAQIRYKIAVMKYGDQVIQIHAGLTPLSSDTPFEPFMSR
jgi:hypothetical protein